MKRTIVVVNDKDDWQLPELDVEVVEAKDYINDPRFINEQGLHVVNLCRSYAYQKLGYYVSLLATARAHKPQPDLTCIEDFKSPTMIRFVSRELDELIQKSLKRITSEQFDLSIYFGKNVARAYDKLTAYLWKMFPSPFVQARFNRTKDKWVLSNVCPVSLEKIPPGHKNFAAEQTMAFLKSPRKMPRKRTKNTRFDLAVLVNHTDPTPPSDKKALQMFCKAAESLGMSAELIEKADLGRIPEFDALFIRETTKVNHHTYRFARSAVANGLVAIDDPLSIIRCCNKVFMMELLQRHRLPTPAFKIVDKPLVHKVAPYLDYPVVLKQPDGAFSQGVIKVDDAASFIARSQEFLEKSDLIIVQEFMPSSFDWRIGVLDGKPLYACRYYMVKDHWQILKKEKSGRFLEGRADTLPISEVPAKLLDIAVKSTQYIGTGLYGVDIKEVNGKYYIIEVNDNPTIESGVEDRVLGLDLYRQIMAVICQRVEKLKR